MPARRCSDCSINWPNLVAYKECPNCGEQTSPMPRQEALSQVEANQFVKQLKFEQEYEKYDRGEEGLCGPGRKGPTPEEIGLEEARREWPGVLRQWREIRGLEQAFKAESES